MDETFDWNGTKIPKVVLCETLHEYFGEAAHQGADESVPDSLPELIDDMAIWLRYHDATEEYFKKETGGGEAG
jgi:hypothetical protein